MARIEVQEFSFAGMTFCVGSGGALRVMDAMLRYYYRIQEPDLLSDEDWAERLMELHFIRTEEAKASKVN